MLRSARIAAIRRIMKSTSRPTALSLMSTSHPRKHVSRENFRNSVTFSKRLALLVCAAVFALPTLLMAQAGSLDPTFGTNGIVTTANTGANAAALQSDGKIVVAGSIPASQNQQQPGLLRYNTNGTLDPNFGSGGEVMIAGNNAGPAFAVAIQTDGKILAAAPDNLRLTVFRFNTNGSPDNTFGSNGVVAIEAAGFFFPPTSGGMAVQSDGKILVATGRVVARLLPNGQLDSTFGSNGAAPTVGGESIGLLPNGEILIGDGSVASLYRANGSLDTKFGVHGQTPGFSSNGAGGFVVSTDPVTNVTKVITAGSLITSPSLTFAQSIFGFLLVRYNSDGTVDNTFANHGGVATPFPGNVFAQAFSVALQTNGDIVAVGQTALSDTGPSDFGLARYAANGKIDTTFGNGGFVITPFGSSVAFADTVLIQPDGKIIAVGNSNNGTTIARYLAN
jgi:uncharacterized delta-60 repeat protein